MLDRMFLFGEGSLVMQNIFVFFCLVCAGYIHLILPAAEQSVAYLSQGVM